MTAPEARARRERAAIAALLVLAVGAVYLQVVDHEFAGEKDRRYFLENPDLRDELSLEGFRSAFSTPYYGTWIPLTAVSMQVEHRLYGDDPTGTLLGNVALHAASAVLLFFALEQLARARWRSAFAAAVFALHPLQVESVAWASNRSGVLAGVFYMLALLLYARYTAGGDALRRYQVMAFTAAVGLLAQPLLVTLPIALMVVDYWPLGRMGSGLPDRRRFYQSLREKLQLIAMILVVGAVNLGLRRDTSLLMEGSGLPVAARLGGALETLVRTAADFFWPRGLAVYYPHPMQDTPFWIPAACALALVAATAIALFAARARPYLLAGWAWYLGTLAAAVLVIPLDEAVHADRLAYVPLIGLSLAVAWGANDLLGRSRAGRLALAVAGICALGALAATARTQVAFWRTPVSLFERSLAVTEDNYIAHNELGFEALGRSDLERARRHLLEAARIRPDWPRPTLGLAQLYGEVGDSAAAIQAYAEVLAKAPKHRGAHAGLGLALLRIGRPDRAVPHLELARAMGAGSGQILGGLAVAYDFLGQPERALAYHREALRLDPSSSAAANNLAWMLATHPLDWIRNPEEAIRVAEFATEGRTPTPGLLDTLAAAYAAGGRYDRAAEIASRAVALVEEAGAGERAASYRARLALYREGRPYVETREAER